MGPRRVFILEIHHDPEEMSSAEILSHLIVNYASILNYVRADIGEERTEKAQRSFIYLVNDVARRLLVERGEVLRMANATISMINGEDDDSAAS